MRPSTCILLTFRLIDLPRALAPHTWAPWFRPQELLAEVKKLNDDPEAQAEPAVSLAISRMICRPHLCRSLSNLFYCQPEILFCLQVHGILVQLPLPEHIKEATVLKSIRVDKDADGLAAENASRHGSDAVMLKKSELNHIKPSVGNPRLFRIVDQLKGFPYGFPVPPFVPVS